MAKKPALVKFNSVGAKGLIGLARKEPQTVIQNVKKLWYFYLKNIVPDSIIDGTLDYTKFILVGRSRTGSNLVRGSLMGHSQITVFGDLFRKPDVIYWGLPFYPQSKGALKLFQTDPVAFINQQIFGKFPSQTQAVGFKTLYPHRHKQVWEPVQAHIRQQKTFKVIHIKRQNILKSHLSLKKVAKRRDQWADISGKSQTNSQPSIHLDYEECLKVFETTRTQEDEYDCIFANNPRLDVFYEELAADYEGQMTRIQEFLGVDYQEIKPLTHKQGGKPLSESITNYFELKEQFEGTPWLEFFTE